MKETVQRYEAHLIRLALKDMKGLVTRAARLLGFKHHQSLISLMNVRHKELLATRSAVRKRRSHIIDHLKQGGEKSSSDTQGQEAHQVSILHVEDNNAVASMVRETLEMEGWKVETCMDGAAALEIIASACPYDLLLLDNDLPGATGLELVRHARSLAHRRETPIVMLSAEPLDQSAFDAGADACLQKPQDVPSLLETITRLLGASQDEDV